MKHILTVIHPFGEYTRGHQITEQSDIDAVMAGENAHHVVKSPAPPEPSPFEPSQS